MACQHDFDRASAIYKMCWCLPSLKMLPPTYFARATDEFIEMLYATFCECGVSQQPLPYHKLHHNTSDDLNIWFSGKLPNSKKPTYDFEIAIWSVSPNKNANISDVITEVNVVKKDYESSLKMNDIFDDFVKYYENTAIHSNLSTKCHRAISIVRKSTTELSFRIVYTVPVVNRDCDTYLSETFLSGSIPLIAIYAILSLKEAFDSLIEKMFLPTGECKTPKKETDEISTEATCNNALSDVDEAFSKCMKSKDKLDDILEEINSLLLQNRKDGKK